MAYPFSSTQLETAEEIVGVGVFQGYGEVP
jgi:hypothetical protein